MEHNKSNKMWDVSVCVACLATNVRMYSMSASSLLQPYQLLAGIQMNDRMPQKLCWECAALVNKFNLFRHKCERAYLLLQDIYNQHDEMTEIYAKTIDREHYQLLSSLSTSKTHPSFTVTFKSLTRSSRKRSRHFATVNSTVKTERVNCDGVETQSEAHHEPAFADYEEVEMDSPNKDDGKTDVDFERSVVEKTNDIKECKKGKKDKHAKKKRVRKKEKVVKMSGKCISVTEQSLTQEQMMKVITDRKSTNAYRMANHRCALCYKWFRELKTYSKHMALHDPTSGSVACDICKVYYKSRAQLRSHIAHNHTTKYTCTICNNISYNKTTARSHDAWHREVVYTCHICGYISSKLTSHLSHRRLKHPSEHLCGECGEPFVSRAGLNRHAKNMHAMKQINTSSEDSRYCADCDIQFSSTQVWTKHILISPKHELERHTIVNGCRACGETFPTESELAAHRRSQHRTPTTRSAGEYTPGPCAQCGKTMTSLFAYYQHFRHEHPKHTYPLDAARPAVCELCGRLFRRVAELAKHRLSHSELRPHECEECGKCFKLKTTLDRHKRTHTDGRRYKCRWCGASYPTSAERNQHLRAAHNKPASTAYARDAYLARKAARAGPRSLSTL